MIELFGILFTLTVGFVGGMYLGAAVERDDLQWTKGQWYVSGFRHGVRHARDHHQAMRALEQIGDDIRSSNQTMEEVREG